MNRKFTQDEAKLMYGLLCGIAKNSDFPNYGSMTDPDPLMLRSQAFNGYYAAQLAQDVITLLNKFPDEVEVNEAS